MKYALSIYLGGQPIAATDSDYLTYAQKGLVCPFCSQAVFWKDGSTYNTKKERTIVRSPCFSHFKAGNGLEAFDTEHECELRSKSKQGEQDIERLFTEAKGQRLVLFNKKFSQIAFDLFPLPWVKSQKQFKAMLKKYFGNLDELQTVFFMPLKRRFKKDFDFWKEEAHIRFSEMQRAISSHLLKDELNFTPFKSFDDQLRLSIFDEALEFLATASSGYAWNDVCWMNLYLIRHELATQKTNELLVAQGKSPLPLATVLPHQTVRNFVPYKKELYASPSISDAFLGDLVKHLCMCQWTKVMTREGC